MNKKTIHILKDKTDRVPIYFMQHIEKSQEIVIILTQNAIEIDLSPLKAQVFVLDELLPASENSPLRKITYDALLEMIFEYDAVVTW